MTTRVTGTVRATLHVIMGPDGDLHAGQRGHIRVQVGPVHFAACVIDDLCDIHGEPDGEALLAALDSLGHVIRIEKPAHPADPPNGFVIPHDRRAATAAGMPIEQTASDEAPVLGSGKGSGGRIIYDPSEWPWAGDPASPNSVQVLRALLRHAHAMAAGQDDPSKIWNLFQEGK